MSNEKFENATLETQKSCALAMAEEYCRKNGMSYDRLKSQRFERLCNFWCFLQPSDVEPQGLKNDMETIPKVTLILKVKDEKFCFEQTEHTAEYLM